MKSKVKELTLQTFPDNFKVPSVVLLTRDGCHFCQNLKPIYERISRTKKYANVYKFYFIDADNSPELYENFKSDGVPTMYVIYDNDGVEIPYPEDPPESGYGEEHIINFLDQLMEE